MSAPDSFLLFHRVVLYVHEPCAGTDDMWYVRAYNSIAADTQRSENAHTRHQIHSINFHFVIKRCSKYFSIRNYVRT